MPEVSAPVSVTDRAGQLLAAADVGGRERLFVSAVRAVRELGQAREIAPRTPAIQLALSIIRSARACYGHGIIWRGRPPWLSETALDAIDEESRARRSRATLLPPPGAHRWASAGHLGSSLATSREARAFVEERTRLSLGEAHSNFNYYDEPGQAAYPHIDEPEFGLNMIVMLEHTGRSKERSSALRLHPVDAPSQDVLLARGEAILFHARSTVHERTMLDDGEIVRIASVGFRIQETPHHERAYQSAE